MRIEYAKLSLQGDRKDNQDRVGIAVSDKSVLLMTFDGMGGHSDGARAAEVALAKAEELFNVSGQPVFDPKGFLYRVLAEAHDAVVTYAADKPVDERARATCAICLIQDRGSYWAHVGDSRIYHIRENKIIDRTRDHSHIEVLLQEGVITEQEMLDHPMRNYVESCLGGDEILPGVTVSGQKRLIEGDILLTCTDGMWSGLDDDNLAELISAETPMLENLKKVGETAVTQNAPQSDNTSGSVLRWLG